MSKFDPIIVCCVCGSKLPYFPKEEILQKRMGTIIGSGQVIHHCPYPLHSSDQILAAINSVPRFVRASEYGKPIVPDDPNWDRFKR